MARMKLKLVDITRKRTKEPSAKAWAKARGVREAIETGLPALIDKYGYSSEEVQAAQRQVEKLLKKERENVTSWN